MKKIITIAIFIILLSSFISADIIINKQPEGLYNLGDTINLPIKIKSLADIEKFFTMNLICNGVETEVYKEYISLSSGEEIERKPFIPLIFSVVERPGNCVIKIILDEENKLTSEFEISDSITTELNIEKEEFSPGENIIIEGDAKKENGQNVQGFVEISIINQNETITEIIDTVKNGHFKVDLPLSLESKAGKAFIKAEIYETDLDGEKTNKGFVNQNILIKQIPTNLEILFENSEVEPGTDLKVRTILHDQTGEKIASTVKITIRNHRDKILEEVEKPTEEILEFPIVYNEAPETWKVIASSDDLSTESTFKIKEKELVRIDLINRTIIMTNKGNIPYNRIVLVKIGDESLNINVSLKVDESQKYTLSAPDGEYAIEVIADEGNKIDEIATLTGKTIDVKESSGRVISLIKYSFIWIFIIAILGFIAFIIFKKGYKKSFFGHMPFKRKRKESRKISHEKDKEIPLKKNSLISTKNRAEVSLSIKGSKQNVSVVCLKIKNLHEIQSRKSNAEETLQKIVNIAEEAKSFIYENQDNLFFISAPIKTKTFKNERIVLALTQKIQEVLKEHNKLSKQKIDFGISLNYGTMVLKEEKDSLKFMSMGTLITTAKKIASISKGEIFLSETIKDKLMTDIKTEKHQKDKVTVYTIKEIKNKTENQKFIRNFLKRIEEKKD